MIKASSKTLHKASSGAQSKNRAENRAKNRDVCQVQCLNQALVDRVGEALPENDLLEEAQVAFSALADKSRLKILHALSDGKELCVCDVASLLNVKVAAASHHLRKLRDRKILKHRNDGKLAYYSIADQRISDILRHALAQLAQ